MNAHAAPKVQKRAAERPDSPAKNTSARRVQYRAPNGELSRKTARIRYCRFV